ncbi:MAG TPA: RNA methyltransferase [Acidimicrobiales bacterium]|nr:RNA methyltransferase [Acidimicrobiales bacterium]
MSKLASRTSLDDVAILAVDDPGDPRLTGYRDLKDTSLRRRTEARQGLFVLEGRFAVEAALLSPYPLVSVLVMRRRLAVLDELGLPPGTTVYVADDEVMNGVAGFDVHRGLLALGRRLPVPSAGELLAGRPRSPLVVVEGVNDQENLGALFRNAAAFAAGAVLLDPTCTDPLYRRCLRVSLGLVLRVPYARVDPWPGPEPLGWLRAHGWVPLALTPNAGAERLEHVAAELAGCRVALLVGAEGAGLSAAALNACRRVRVAVAPGVDSLNVAAATAVALHRFSELP